MSFISSEILTVTTAADGSGAAQISNNTAGVLYAIRYVKVDFADGHDFTLTVVNSGQTDTLFTGTDVNASIWYAPRMDSHTVAAVAQSANNQYIPFVGKLKITVAQGGNVKSGKYILYWIE